ncbi:MAG TPA: lysophospholipid acyltransferase family protein [Syntrophales bacterium]|nr:lysophospholipid acyltransferase family protein [Syntrophales bacterium]
MSYTIFDIPILRNLLQVLSIVVLRIFGWRRSGQLPKIPKFVVIAAPHTSNWDFPIGLAIVFAFKMKMNWLGKDSLFRWPFGSFFKWLGGIPISRSKSGDIVAQMIKTFKIRAKMVMVVAPEGTRKKVKYWKTGFYRIAQGADIPIVMGFIDYVRKMGGFGPTLMPCGDIESDIEKIRAFYDNVTGKIPAKSTPAMIAPQSGHGSHI